MPLCKSKFSLLQALSKTSARPSRIKPIRRESTLYRIGLIGLLDSSRPNRRAIIIIKLYVVLRSNSLKDT